MWFDSDSDPDGASPRPLRFSGSSLRELLTDSRQVRCLHIGYVMAAESPRKHLPWISRMGRKQHGSKALVSGSFCLHPWVPVSLP